MIIILMVIIPVIKIMMINNFYKTINYDIKRNDAYLSEN